MIQVPFTIENFLKLFAKSDARKNLNSDEIAQIRTAIEHKDEQLLKNLFQILLEEKKSQDEIMDALTEDKEKIMDEFNITMESLHSKHVEGPKKEMLAEMEQEEKAEAENILKQIK
ncbi:hypothetical protein GF340_02310 [Candidatus Peregrinibacteria bacterium]|nr:hypothetical protein [Candidatus Peregrinibacteria bacterium]